jgi:hypothetical protein
MIDEGFCQNIEVDAQLIFSNKLAVPAARGGYSYGARGELTGGTSAVCVDASMLAPAS